MTTDGEEDQRREQIEAAFIDLLRDVPPRHTPPVGEVEIERRRRDAIDAVMDVFDNSGDGTVPLSFRKIGAKGSNEELAELAKLAEKLADHIEALHEPAIVALGDVGLEGTFRLGLPTALRDISRRVGQAIVPDVGKVGRRPANVRNQAWVSILSYHYWRLSGKSPTLRYDPEREIHYGPFLDLITTVFGIYGIDAGFVDLAKDAVKEWNSPKE